MSRPSLPPLEFGANVYNTVRHLPSADRIIVMDQGTVTFQGSLDQLQAPGYDLSRLVQAVDSFTEERSSEKKDQSTARNDHKAIKKSNGASRNEELKKSYLPQGLRPYRFWVHNAGAHRVATSFLFITFAVVLTMGMNVSISAPTTAL